jgi:acyl dehydratase
MDPGQMSQSMQDALAAASAPTTDPGISAATYGALADQNAQAAATMDAVSAGLDANAAGQGTGETATSGFGIGDLLGISSAKAGEFNPANSGMAAIQDAARAAAAQGQYDQFVSNPNYAANIDSALHSQLSAQSNAVNSQTATTASNPYGALTMTPGQAQQAELAGQISTIGSTPDAALSSTTSSPYGSLTMSPSQAQQAELAGALAAIGSNQAAGTSAVQSTQPELSLAITDPGSQLGSFVGPGGFTTAGPSSTGNAYQGTTAVGPDATTGLDISGAPQGANATDEAAPTTSLTVSKGFDNPTVLPSGGDAASPTTDLTISKGLTTPNPTKFVDTSNIVTTPTVLPYLDGTSTTDTSTSTTASSGTTTPTTTPTTTIDKTTTPLSAQNAILRKYLGAGSNLYRYGMGPEHTYYGPAAAKGGYFDAEQYFADGGLVQPLSPPTTPVVSAQPTMAFTDGAGPVGSIAQPPGMFPSDSIGSDAPHASPMAPSVAAAVPSFQPGLATLAMPNVNASPSPSPIAQNPNVGYALGNSPLSNLARS